MKTFILMTRTVLAIATALVVAVTLSTSAANACISCEYVPEVVRSSSTLPHTGHYYSAKPYASNKEHAAPAKRRVVKSEPVAKKRILKSEPAAKMVETAATTPVKAESENENSTISTAAVDLSENTGANEAPIEAASDRNVGCKKYFPTVGMTLTVPCE